jgi:acetyl esterase/lipase
MTEDTLLITENIVYAEPGGTVLEMDLYRRSGGTDMPVLLVLHGGGWCVGTRQGVESYARIFAEAGYLAATVSYRLAPAFPFPAACQDVTAAAAWLVAHAAEYGGDARRLGAYGGSAGAHLALWLATAPDTPLVCAVAWAGPTDMHREPVTYPYRGYAMAFMGACVHDAPQAYREASPLLRMTAAMPPVLLVHGAADDCVPADHARWMAAEGQAIGAPVEMILLEGVKHTGGNPEDPREAAGWQAMMAFYARHLQPCAARV